MATPQIIHPPELGHEPHNPVRDESKLAPTEDRGRRRRFGKRAKPEVIEGADVVAVDVPVVEVEAVPEVAVESVDEVEPVVVDEAPAAMVDVTVVPEAAVEPDVVADVLELPVEEIESKATPTEKQRRRRRFGKRAKPEEYVPAPVVESAWPPVPTLAGIPEPTPAPEAAPAASANRVVDFSRPPIQESVVAGVVEPERDWDAPKRTAGRPSPAEELVYNRAASDTREVVIPEIVDLTRARWATPPVAEPVVDLTAEDAAGTPDVEVVEADEPAPQPTLDLPARTRAIRVKTLKTDGKRRWVVDVLVKQPDEDEDRA